MRKKEISGSTKVLIYRCETVSLPKLIKGYSTFVCPPPPDPPPWGGGGGDPYIIQIGGRGDPYMFTLNIEKKTLSEGGTPTKSKLGVGGDPYTFCRGGVRPQGANKSGIALRV